MPVDSFETEFLAKIAIPEQVSNKPSKLRETEGDEEAEEEIEEIRQDRIKAQRELEEMKESMEEDPGASL